MYQPKRLLFMLAGVTVLLLTQGARAAQSTLIDGGPGITVRTGTTGGSCNVIHGGAEGITVECIDGANQAKANSLIGCFFTQGSGLCAGGTDIDPELTASTQLKCPNGNEYSVSTGDDQGTCTVSGTGPNKSTHCESTEPNAQVNSSNATCEDGCGNTSGSGCCCRVGTPGCDPGQSC